MHGNELIDPIALSQDPYSDVSLFLARKIKELGSTAFNTKGWSLNLQDRLLEKITPEFGKKFPSYRLGAAAVKKTWEKVSHLSQLFEKQNNVLTPDGALNLHFLIRENLKTTLAQQKNSSFHPFLLAQQLALKVGESLAAYEGVRPQLEQLTELIWTALKHLLPAPSQTNRIPDIPDVKDRLLSKWMIDVLTKQPGIPYHDLYRTLQEKLKLFKAFKGDITPWTYKLCMEWAEALLPHTTFFQTQSGETIRRLKAWIHTFLRGSSKDPQPQIQDIKTASLSLKHRISLYDLEILSWSCLHELGEVEPATILPPFYDELVQEAKSHLIHHPQELWKTAIIQAALFIKKAGEISGLGNKSEWNDRIELWSSQGELILRSMELPETPLLYLVRTMHLKGQSLADPSSTAKLREQYLYRYSSPLIGPSRVHQMADLMRKYGWYRLASSPTDATIERWIALNEASHAEHLPEKALKELPLLPIINNLKLR